MQDKNKFSIVHSMTTWLPQTMTWLYTQIKFVEQFDSIILCEEKRNIDQFPMENIFARKELNPLLYNITRVKRKLGLIPYPAHIVNRIRKEKGVILHSHFGPTGWKDIKFANRLKLKHVVTFYGIDVNHYPQQYTWKKRYQELFGKIDLVLCEGPFMAKSIANLGCEPDKISVHHLGIDLERIPFEPRTYSQGETLRILIAGTFREKKGVPYALEAIKKLRERDKDVIVSVTIIGDANTEKERLEKNRILKLVNELTTEDVQVKLLGYVSYERLLEEAYKHHLFASPSVTASDGDTEGGAPVSIIEMAASGMPILSTTHCDIPNVLAEENRKLLAEERNTEQLYTALHQLINKDWTSIITSNRKHIEQHFDAKIQGKLLEKKYSELL